MKSSLFVKDDFKLNFSPFFNKSQDNLVPFVWIMWKNSLMPFNLQELTLWSFGMSII